MTISFTSQLLSIGYGSVLFGHHYFANSMIHFASFLVFFLFFFVFFFVTLDERFKNTTLRVFTK